MSTFFVDCRATRAHAAVWLRRIFLSPVSFVAYGLLLYPFFRWSVDNQDFVMFMSLLAQVLAFVLIVRAFIQQKLENDAQPPFVPMNLAAHLSSDVQWNLRWKMTLEPVDLFEASVSSPRGRFVLEMMGLQEKEVRARCHWEIVQAEIDLLSLLEEAEKIREMVELDRITAPIILYLFLKRDGAFKEMLHEADLSLKDVRTIVQWEHLSEKMRVSHGFFSPEGLAKRFGGLGRGWVIGYTRDLDRLTDNISDHIQWEKKFVRIHKEEMKSAMHILSRSKQHNLLVLGKHGAGKHAMVRNLTYALRKHEIDKSLPFTSVLELNTHQLLSGTEKPDTFLLEALKGAKDAGRFILVIPNMALFLQADNAMLTGVLTKFLEAENINIIGIADTQDYHSLIKTNPSLDSLFEKVTLDDATEEETMAVLMETYFDLRKKKGIRVTFKALRSIVELCKRYLGKGSFPGKAIEVLEDAVLAAKQSGHKEVTEDHVRSIISLKSHQDIKKMTEDEKEHLLGLEEILKQRVIGQEYAVSALVNALKRARLDIRAGNRPKGTFLFLGPTGVGKTETAKALAAEYYGSEESLIRLDMNEFSSESSTIGIIGSADPTVKTGEGYLSKRVQDRPSSLILLDEIEKAHPNVLNLFLQILDEGVMTDARGVKTDFRNTIIIATSNAGALFIRDFIKQHQELNKEEFKKALVDTILKDGSFSPEFINRFDEVLLYFPLSMEDAEKVAGLMVQKVADDLMESKGISLDIHEDALEYIVEKGYSIEFGAREMRRTVTDLIENFVADYLLRNEVRRGEAITITRADLESR